MFRTHDVLRALTVLAVALPAAFTAGCSDAERSTDQPVLAVAMPLHLEEHLHAANVSGPEVPLDVPDPLEWRFDEPGGDWKALRHTQPDLPPPLLEWSEGALRVSLDETHERERFGRKQLHGDIWVRLPDLTRAEWSHVLVRARAAGKISSIQIGFNLRPLDDETEVPAWRERSFLWVGDNAVVVNDGTIHTYWLRADWSRQQNRFEDPWRELGLTVEAAEPSSLEILSIALVPKASLYAGEPAGVRTETRGISHRRVLYTRVPGRIDYRVRVPENGRFDVGLGVVRDDLPVDFRVAATLETGEERSLLEESYSDRERWQQRSVDLSAFGGQIIRLSLEVDADEPGAVAFWATPTISAQGRAEKPNVIFYVLDGGGADYMSLYGYHRRTTPNLERLAAEGAVFERAYSNSSWSKPSTTSFMTSLHSSVLGNTRDRFDPLPEEVVTMAQHFHQAGYQTAVFTSNAWAGSMSSLERGVDRMRDAGVERDSTSSIELHQDFWNWRAEYPGGPYWVHFQPTDVHSESGDTDPPFRGLFLSPDQEKTWRDWDERLKEAGDHGVYRESFEKTGISRPDFFSLHQRMIDQNMAHQDYQLGQFIARLKAIGEWENTLMIIGADHSIRAAADDMGIAIQDELPPQWTYAIFRPSVSRVPLIFFWPGHIDGGQRFDGPVSMIDVLPTVLDLVGLPAPEVLQGQSLAPLLQGREGWALRPVVFEEVWLDSASGELHGLEEMVDGRWGASLWVGPDAEEEALRRPMPLLLFDLWNDPWCLSPANDDWPDLVEHYSALLKAQWRAHRVLAEQFTPGGEVALTPEQLETLRALGYI